MGISKNARLSKRSSSSSSSYLPSVVTFVVFVAFCLLGLWMLTSSASSSLIPSRATTTTPTRHFSSSRFNLDSLRAAFDDNPGDLPDDAIKRGGGDDDNEEKGVADNYRFGSSDDDLGRKGLKRPIEPLQEEEEAEQQQQRHQSIAVDKVEPRDMEIDKPTERGGAGNDSDEQSLIQEMTHGDGDKQPIEEDNMETRSGSTDVERQQQQQHQQQQAIEQAEVEGAREDQELKEIVKDDENSQTQTEETAEEKTEPSFEIQNQHQSQEDEGVENEQQLTSEESSVDNGLSETEETVENQQPQAEDSVENQQSQMDESGESQETVENQQSLSEESAEIQNPETEEKIKDLNSNETFPDGAQSEISRETNFQQGSWSTQADQSENEKERQKEASALGDHGDRSVAVREGSIYGYSWELCNVTAGPDYIPCLDNELALKKLHNTKHFEHRERHCPDPSPTCLVPLPKGYKRSIRWPQSRDKIWYTNVPRTKLAAVKGHQNWVKVSREYLTFPGGGTQFIHGALHYIDFIQQSVPDIAWGKRTRVVLDVGCGVASFGGYLFDRDVLAMSFAPKDEHEAQVQFALERGIPAISAVMGSQRLPFPSRVFDVVHCARCRVPWHAEGGTLLLELNRVLRPGGYFVWSATPVYQKLKEDVEIWKAMTSLTKSMCWDLFTIKKDRLNSISAAIYRKPTSNECYKNRKHNNPPMCEEKDDPDAAWYVPLQTCMHRVPEDSSKRGSQWPEEWPVRMLTPPYWLNRSQVGVYGKPAPEDFLTDYQHWKRVVNKSYLNGMGIDWSSVRNVMDMRAVYGGFAAALRDLKVWVMNVVNVNSPDTLPIIYERGLFGIYHDWCESFSTYPRTYDLLHADHLFSTLKERCNIVVVMAEIDRILRPGGKLIVRDVSISVSEVENMVKSLHWEVRLTYSKDHDGILCAQKSDWRPETY